MRVDGPRARSEKARFGAPSAGPRLESGDFATAEQPVLPEVAQRVARNLRVPHLLVGAYIVVTAVVPYLYGHVLAVVVAVALVAAFLSGPSLPRGVLGWTLALVTLGLVGTLIGAGNGNPGAWSTMSVYIAEPLILGPLFGLLYSNAQGVQTLLRVLDRALLATSILGLLVYLASTRGFALPTFLVDPRFDTADLSGETLRTNFQGYNSLVFLAPYGVLRALKHEGGGRTWYRGLLLVAALASVILSGRRILYITTPAVVVIGLILFLRGAKDSKKRGGGWRLAVLGLSSFGGIVLVAQAIGLHYTSALSRTLAQFTLSDPSDVRVRQAAELLGRWEQSPEIGWGSGAVVPGYVRNAETPWAYELTYHTLLLNFGILGVGLLVWWAAWMALRLVRGGRAGSIHCQLLFAGFLGTILACSVDPYVLKFDGLWMLFAPFGVAAGVTLHQTKRRVPA